MQGQADEQAVFEVFEGLFECGDDAAAAVSAEGGLRIDKLLDEIHCLIFIKIFVICSLESLKIS